MSQVLSALDYAHELGGGCELATVIAIDDPVASMTVEATARIWRSLGRHLAVAPRPACEHSSAPKGLRHADDRLLQGDSSH